MSNTTLYSQDLPKIILLSDVYDPDIDFGSIENTSKIIPAVGSLLIDGTDVYVVVSVDAATHKTTYKPISIEQSVDLKRILEYGNTFFALFYAKTIITDYTGTQIALTRLGVDDKVTFFGDHITNYDIVRPTADGKEVVVSQCFDSTMKPKGTTCVVSGTTDNKKCLPCYSYEEFKPGKQYVLRAFDSAGNLIARIQLVTVEASILTDLYSDYNPIVGLEVTSNQVDADGKIFLYKNQDRNDLTIYVILKYQDGSQIVIGVDNQFCFLYGKEAINPKHVGTYDLTVKYFLAKDEATIVNDGICDNRFLVKEFQVYVREFTQTEISKVSIIPRYSAANQLWRLEALAYFTNRSAAPQLIQNATFEGWSATRLNEKQSVKIKATITQIDGTITDLEQQFFIEVRNPVQKPDNPFLLSDTADQVHVYGDDTINRGFIAPRMRYGAYSPTMTGYFIPKNIYTATSQYETAVKNFLTQFYEAINPPKASTEVNPPVPTHFTIRCTNSPSTTTLLAAPIPVENFESFMDLRWTMIADQYKNDCLVVEFWKKKDTEDDYDILFGVPVFINVGDNTPA